MEDLGVCLPLAAQECYYSRAARGASIPSPVVAAWVSYRDENFSSAQLFLLGTITKVSPPPYSSRYLDDAGCLQTSETHLPSSALPAWPMLCVALTFSS